MGEIMLKMDNVDIEYSICEYDVLKDNLHYMIHIKDTNEKVELTKLEQYVWTLLIACYKGACDISDVSIGKCMCNDNKLDVGEIIEHVYVVRNIINTFIDHRMILVNKP